MTDEAAEMAGGEYDADVQEAMEGPPDLAAYLHQLRRDFSQAGILADPPAGRWMAVLPGGVLLRARTGLELREKLTELAARSRRPSRHAPEAVR